MMFPKEIDGAENFVLSVTQKQVLEGQKLDKQDTRTFASILQPYLYAPQNSNAVQT